MKTSKLIPKILIGLLIVAMLAICYLQFHGAFQKDILKNSTFLHTDNPFIVMDNTDVAAHRMGGGLYPEDTLMSAEKLVSDIENGLYNVNVIEVDLWLTKDNELILLHDETLDRTTDSYKVFGVENAKPGDYTLSELKMLNFGANFQAEDGSYPYSNLKSDEVPENLRVLTLRHLLDYTLSKGDFKYILEIKNSGEEGIEAMNQLALIVKEYGMEEKTILASFNEELLLYLDEAFPELHRHASLSETVTFTIDFLLNKDIEKCEYPYDVLDITPRYGIFWGTSSKGQKYGILNLMTQGYINRAHKCGIAIYYWTVNDESTMQKLIKRNADCIITDYPNVI